jgi:hypothetical protein
MESAARFLKKGRLIGERRRGREIKEDQLGGRKDGYGGIAPEGMENTVLLTPLFVFHWLFPALKLSLCNCILFHSVCQLRLWWCSVCVLAGTL